jgi:hypothetical protein
VLVEAETRPFWLGRVLVNIEQLCAPVCATLDLRRVKRR